MDYGLRYLGAWIQMAFLWLGGLITGGYWVFVLLFCSFLSLVSFLNLNFLLLFPIPHLFTFPISLQPFSSNLMLVTYLHHTSIRRLIPAPEAAEHCPTAGARQTGMRTWNAGRSSRQDCLLRGTFVFFCFFCLRSQFQFVDTQLVLSFSFQNPFCIHPPSSGWSLLAFLCGWITTWDGWLGPNPR